MAAKITKAASAQWQQIDVLRQQVIDGVTQQPPDAEVHRVVRDMWRQMGKDPTAILIFDCPITCALGAALLDQLGDQLYRQLGDHCRQLGDQLSSQLGDQLHSQLDSQLHNQLYRQLRNQLDSQLDSQLRNQLYRQLHNQLYRQLRNQLDSQLYRQLHNQQPAPHLRNQLDNQLDNQLRNQLGDQLAEFAGQVQVYLFSRAWSGWYEGAQILGVQFDQAQFDLFTRWTKCVPVIHANARLPVVSRFPEQVLWKDGRLHNDKGKSVRFRSGWGLWTIEGTPVNEQIVMRPETQTVEQIDKEANQDVRSIRIERFGWPRYIRESGAACIDGRDNAIEGTIEALYRCQDGSCRLVVTCPTGRVFALGVPGNVETCRQAQHWLAGGRNFRVLART